ncbi:hypothetical protein [Tsukamurella sp. USMM236]|uniref:hypothetical protein n=1 Tax=Tsukamurella sp. USMM236 TaxID=3081301 RepID=UPI003015E1AA
MSGSGWVSLGTSSRSLFEQARRQQEREEAARCAYWDRRPRTVGIERPHLFRAPRALPEQDTTGKQTHIYGSVSISADKRSRGYGNGARCRTVRVINDRAGTTLWSDSTCCTHEEAIQWVTSAVNWYRRDAEANWGARILNRIAAQ